MPKVRIAGAGSVFEDSRGLWNAWVELPPVNGDRRRKVLRAKTVPALREKVRKFNELREQTGEVPGVSPTVEQWMTHWLNDIAAADVRPKTLGNYRSMTKNHILPSIGKARLDQLAPSSIREMHKKIEGNTSSTTALTVHRILSSALAAAQREGKVARNVAQLVRAPKRNLVDLDVLTVEEASRLISMFGDSEEAYLWATFLLTGARRGEILGLRWSHVTDVLDLEWQLQRHRAGTDFPVDYEHHHLRGGLYLTRPKSRAGVRVVPLVEPLAGIISRWRSVAPENPHGLVFTMPDGSPIDPDFATHKWAKVRAAAGIDRNVRLHDLRHTAIDLLYEAGVPEDVIREIVGHSTRAMTRAYKSRASRERLTAELAPFTKLLTPPAEDTPRAVGA